jgi:glucose-6-phosphate 1-dehydrogenase
MSKSPSSPIIVIYGITGDLSRRKLLPALYHLLAQELLSDETKIIGTSRRDLSVDDLLKTVELCVLEADNKCDPVVMAKVRKCIQTQKLDPSKDADFETLKKTLEEIDSNRKREWLFYMSVPSSAYAPIVNSLAKHNMNTPNARVLLEKPFGYDVKSAEELIAQLNKDFVEDQIYRIDHYLAKETAQNILAFRIHNPIFKPLWNTEHIKSVRVRAYESIGIENRADFYEQTGALRDLIQSHLMQLLSITLMDLPDDMNSDAIHEKKEKFLKSLKPADPKLAYRAQYDKYKEEVKNPKSNIETFAKVVLKHDSFEWRETDMILETGKDLDEHITEVTVDFNTPHERQRNNLKFRIQPSEGISLDLVVKRPGLGNQMEHTSLAFDYKRTFNSEHYLDAYERVLMDAVNGDQSLFSSDQEVLATWRVLQPILEKWKDNSDGMDIYKVGTRPKPKTDD